ncbi:WD repeat-containing protein [Punctularia strigosozonata HHB-11173 SS5]|uniref:WD repeat-containing protein n=1 Tax=Punctularia strigosozonata (strain HHB-11173) TaxID=741275 RepID=UPI0004418052|nr:WD repeat-containing protein [Punctularia strigosozonata HHB-11173 SS5]EIN14095.1 WD repeat-containing protein [Punctularia strigosozonata HHB-11173 SS5]
MLDILRDYAQAATGDIHYLALPKETLLVHPFADTVVIRNAKTLMLIRVLAFWEAFPGTRHSKASITSISVDAAMKLIVAVMQSRVAVWSLSSVNAESGTWRLHSSLALPEGQDVHSVHCQSGLLALASRSGLSVHTLSLENDLPTWSAKWRNRAASSQTIVRLSPSLSYIASACSADNKLRLHNATSGRLLQIMPHPRTIVRLIWRKSSHSDRQDLILYTITLDSVIRVFLPILDSPQRLQLHATIDVYSSVPLSGLDTADATTGIHSGVTWLDHTIISDSIRTVQKTVRGHAGHDESSTLKRLQDILEDSWDLFLRILQDRSVIVTAVTNLDRRPPTLLRQLTLMHSGPSFYHRMPASPDMLLLPNSQNPAAPILVHSSPLASYEIDLLSFFDAQPRGLRQHGMTHNDGPNANHAQDILRFLRTSDGRGLAVVKESGGEHFSVDQHGTTITRVGEWATAGNIVVLNQGRSIAVHVSEAASLMLYTDSKLVCSLRDLPSLTSLFSLPRGQQDSIVGVTSDASIVLIYVDHTPSPTMTLRLHTSLPLDIAPHMILPVDPMAWSTSFGQLDASPGMDGHDTLLSLSESGELAFWVPDDDVAHQWRCTGRVKTGRKCVRIARCSSAKKSVLLVPVADGEEMTIWDSKESEFASGLEYRKLLRSSELVNDLDWTATPDKQSILAVGFAQRIEFLCQRRMTYFDEGFGWDICWRIDLSSVLPQSISDSIWLANGSFLVGAGPVSLIYSQFGRRNIAGGQESSESLFEHVARHNGPLDDYHPQMLLQCLLWDRVQLVKETIVRLARYLAWATVEDKSQMIGWQNHPIDRYFEDDAYHGQNTTRRTAQYSTLFAATDSSDPEDDNRFSPSLVERLVKQLELEPLPHLSSIEHAHLLSLIETTLEVDEQRRALDANGLRYLISMRSFYILNSRASSERTSKARGKPARRARLRYRDIVWAFHSESQEILLSASIAACEDKKMNWADARALGVFMWLTSTEAMRSHMEAVARNQYMAGDARDPTACSLLYFALGKVKLVHGLWRQAAWHKEQQMMLKFLANDFTQDRWRTAALKNAYALLSKQRFEYAAAFFLLGGGLKEATNICVRYLQDFQLAVALARVVEGDSGIVLKEILEQTIVPIAFEEGNRWLGSWAFWLLRRRDVAVRILVTPLDELALSLSLPVREVGNPHYDDPSLSLLFSQLRMKTLQTAKGTSEISGRTEFNFVLQTARVFCRMGCHSLALSLVRSWPFLRAERPRAEALPTTAAAARSIFARQGSVLIDMVPPTMPPTRATSPIRHPALSADGDAGGKERDGVQATMGGLFKSAKHDIQVPEFDMSSFNF